MKRFPARHAFPVIVQVLLALSASLAETAAAGWSHRADENLLVAGSPGAEYVRDAKPDGNGGMWIAWNSFGPGLDGPFLQRIRADGEPLLGAEGIRLSTVIAQARDMDILPTDDGGVFVAWGDQREGLTADIYMQRVSPSGGLLWDPSGVLIERGPDVAVAVGNGGVISHSLDGGETWTSVTSGTSQSLLGVSVVSNRILAAGDAGTFLESKDLGVSWDVLRTGGTPDLNALDLYSSWDGVAVGDLGRSWTWDGTQWTLAPAGNATDFLGVSMPGSQIATAVGRNGRIARSTDGGVTWTEQTSGTGLNLRDVSFSSEDVGTAVGNGGTILRTVDGGANWTPQVSGTTSTLMSVDFLDDQIGAATGGDGVALYTNDGGATWTQGSTPVVILYMGVDVTDANTAVAVGQSGIIIKTEDGGANWSLRQAPSAVGDFWEVSAPGNVTWQTKPKLVDDGAGGALVLWHDQQFGASQVVAQRIDGSGSFVWPAPVQMTDSPEDVTVASAVARSGGAILVWEDHRSDPNIEIYSQAIDLDGNLLQAQPSVVSDHASAKYDLAATSDGLGGAIVGWSDHRTIPPKIYGRRLSSLATPGWTIDGQTVAAAAQYTQSEPSIVADGAGGAFFVWEQSGGSGLDIFAQHVDGAGNLLWPGADLQVNDTPGNQRRALAAPDGLGGFVVGWIDERTSNSQLHVQAVGADGTLRWQPNGVPVRAGLAGSVHNSPSIRFVVSDAAGGAMTVWSDWRDRSTNDWDLYAQNIDRHGYLGLARGEIASVVDVPQDQGGFATVSWDASYLDAFPNQVITHYSVWRRNPAVAKLTGADLERSRAAALGAGLDPVLVAAQSATGWAYVDTSPAAYLPSYGYDAPTYGEGSPTDFQVIAHTADPFVHWISAPGSGISVDNLAPDAPVSLLAAEASGQIELVWNDGLENVEDVDHYRVYRGTSPGFVVGPPSLLSTAAQKTHVDPSPGSPTVFYRVSAVDVHGNESGPSNEAGVGAVTAVDSKTSFGFRLRSPFPNPSNGSSLFRFALPASGRVGVALFDLAGRRVYETDLGSLSEGWHEQTLRARDGSGRRLASGTYLLQLSHGGQKRTTKVVITR